MCVPVCEYIYVYQRVFEFVQAEGTGHPPMSFLKYRVPCFSESHLTFYLVLSKPQGSGSFTFPVLGLQAHALCPAVSLMASPGYTCLLGKNCLAFTLPCSTRCRGGVHSVGEPLLIISPWVKTLGIMEPN